jgi:hypothetical protein
MTTSDSSDFLLIKLIIGPLHEENKTTSILWSYLKRYSRVLIDSLSFIRGVRTPVC